MGRRMLNFLLNRPMLFYFEFLSCPKTQSEIKKIQICIHYQEQFFENIFISVSPLTLCHKKISCEEKRPVHLKLRVLRHGIQRSITQSISLS